MKKDEIFWIGTVTEKVWCVLKSGRTFRLDKDDQGNRYWQETGRLPLDADIQP